MNICYIVYLVGENMKYNCIDTVLFQLEKYNIDVYPGVYLLKKAVCVLLLCKVNCAPDHRYPLW